MASVPAPGSGRTAPDGSPYPDRTQPAFEREVRRMFSHIAGKYEWFDHVASLGSDLIWRPRALWAVDRFRDTSPVRWVLDIGCGTGEFTFLAAHHYPQARVIGTDFTSAMLAEARHRRDFRLEGDRIALARGTALSLPFADGSFDLILNAFVVRNLPNLDRAFRELRRVLRPGGVLASLEITEPEPVAVRRFFHAYFDHVVPWLGASVASAGPYRYLSDSLRSLPDRTSLLDLLRRAGFPRVAADSQSMGIVTTFLAEAGPVDGPAQSR